MQGYFYGWYLKCQSDTETLAVIPAVHRAGGKSLCSIQVITDSRAWAAGFPADRFCRSRNHIRIGDNFFGEKGIRLSIHRPQLHAVGQLNFGPLSPLKYDIMGPFALVPFMECRHSVRSMLHSVSGSIWVNGREYSFEDGRGYWEGDRGRSFPKKYVWTQCSFPDGSLMLSAADIPLAGIHFTGVIGNVLWRGKQYRLATYLGARAAAIHDGMIRIVQGDLELEARLLDAWGRPLKAPVGGDMIRTIHEAASCRAFYRFRHGGRTLFAFETEQASFEYEYPSSTLRPVVGINGGKA